MKLIPIYIIVLLASCRTVKNIETVREVYDSTAVKQRDSAISVYKRDSAYWASRELSTGETTIIFQDTGRVVTKIEYRPDGSIKTVEGNLKSVTARLEKEKEESGYWKSQYDSLASHKSLDSTKVNTEYVTVTKKVKITVFPWYFWLLLVVALVIGWRLNKIPALKL